MRKYVSLSLALLLTAFGATCIVLAALYVRPNLHGDVSGHGGRLLWALGLGVGWPFALGLLWLLADLSEWRRRP